MTNNHQIAPAELQNRLDIEMAFRSPPTIIPFFLGAIIYSFLTLPELPPRFFPSLSALIIFVNLIRFRAAQETVRSGILTSRNRNQIYISIFLNSTIWSILFSFATYSIGFKDWRIAGPMLTMFGLMAASPFTLSYSVKTFLYLVFSWSLPQVAILLYKNKMDPIQTDFLTIYLANIVLLAAYCLRQGYTYRKQLIEKIINEAILKKTNEELFASREKILEQTAMTQHANRLSVLGEMAAGIAHEINNPLTIISGNLQYIEKILDVSSMESGPRDRYKVSIYKAQESVSRISKIIKGLRILTRTSDREELVKHNLKDIVLDTLDFCEEKFNLSKSQLRIEGQQDLMIECRPVQISQILINLLSNAFDAMEEKKMDQRYVSIRSRRQANQIFLMVCNPGPEIERPILEKLFQPFFTTKEIGKGSGLGLSISRGMAKQHGGDLYYYRDDEKFENHFILILPVQKEVSNE